MFEPYLTSLPVPWVARRGTAVARKERSSSARSGALCRAAAFSSSKSPRRKSKCQKMSCEHEKQTQCEHDVKRCLERCEHKKKPDVHRVFGNLFQFMGEIHWIRRWIQHCFSMIQQCLENEFVFHIQLISSICVHFARLLSRSVSESVSVFAGGKGSQRTGWKLHHSTGVRNFLCRCDI
jgi:hypothetical protein